MKAKWSEAEGDGRNDILCPIALDTCPIGVRPFRMQDRRRGLYESNYQRAEYKDLETIRVYFELVQDTILKYSILKEDIYNFNKTSF